jgi:hypothetical protein
MNRFFGGLEAQVGLLDVPAGQEIVPRAGQRHPPVLEDVTPVSQV